MQVTIRSGTAIIGWFLFSKISEFPIMHASKLFSLLQNKLAFSVAHLFPIVVNLFEHWYFKTVKWPKKLQIWDKGFSANLILFRLFYSLKIPMFEKNYHHRRSWATEKIKCVLKPVKQWEQLGNMNDEHAQLKIQKFGKIRIVTSAMVGTLIK